MIELLEIVYARGSGKTKTFLKSFKGTRLLRLPVQEHGEDEIAKRENRIRV